MYRLKDSVTNMLENERPVALSGLRLTLKRLNLYNRDGVNFKYNKNGDSVRIPDFFAFSLISLPTVHMTLLLIWFVIEEEFNLKLMSTTLAIAIGGRLIISLNLWKQLHRT